MTLSLLEVKESTKPITDKLETQELQIPEPSKHWERKIAALEEASLANQRAAAIFDMRCEQAEMLGFKKIHTSEMVKMLMGDSHTETDKGEERQTHEYAYFHVTGKELLGKDCDWGGKSTIFIRKEKVNAWFLPPFREQEVWRCQFGKLDYLKREIPYPVVLQLNELKKLKLFNAFSVLAPMEAWERKTDIDPIMVATIWETPPNEEKGKESTTAGQTAHFFLAQW